MSNPFGKKNPFMSMWLSGAHSLANKARGHASAQAKRHVTTTVTKAAQDVADMWTNVLLPRPTNPQQRRR